MTRSDSPYACAPTAFRASPTLGQRHRDRGRDHEGLERQPDLGQRCVGQLSRVPLGDGELPPVPATARSTDAHAAGADASAHADVGEMHARSRFPHVRPGYHCRRPPAVDGRQHGLAGLPHRAERVRSSAATVHERCGSLKETTRSRLARPALPSSDAKPRERRRVSLPEGLDALNFQVATHRALDVGQAALAEQAAGCWLGLAVRTNTIAVLEHGGGFEVGMDVLAWCLFSGDGSDCRRRHSAGKRSGKNRPDRGRDDPARRSPCSGDTSRTCR